MTVSIRRLSLGSGYAYLMRSVARGDGGISAEASGSSPLTRYYAETGTPAGRWLGAGLAGLDDGHGLEVGSEVTEQQLWRLLGMLSDPVTGDPLGRRAPHWPAPVTQRIAARVDALPAGLSGPERAAKVAQIGADETQKQARVARPVAAFDLTFSVPKSVSTVWALADPDTQASILAAHRDAIAIALKWAEQQIVFTRTGTAGAFQEPVRGLITAAFDHWDSRAGDPHLHSHVVVANRVQTLDGRWRTLDSKTLHRYTVALSELHHGVLQDLLAERLGYTWTPHARAHSPVPRWDITGVPTDLMERFSQRSTAIAAAKDDLIVDFAATHGRHPTDIEILRLRQTATLATRGDKQHRSLRDSCASWRDRATDLTGPDPAAWARELPDVTTQENAAQPEVSPLKVEHIAVLTLDTVATKRATFGHANLLAEAHRRLHGHPFPTAQGRLEAADRIVALALREALLLNPPDPATPELRLHKGADLYTTRAVFDAETRLLDAGRDTTAPALLHALTDHLPERNDGVTLGSDQAAAVADVATSGRRVDLLIGPAGTGKTTSLRALRIAWEGYYGPGSVVGVAPSAAAAEVLATQLGIPADNTTKWLLEHAKTAARDARIGELQAQIDAGWSPATALARQIAGIRDPLIAERNRWALRPGQLLILDEASLASTVSLDHLVQHAAQVGAKLLLVGDPHQLGPVDAGGAFTMLTRDRDTVAELTDPRRFTEDWERAASLRLRAGDPSVIDTYTAHDRIHAGERDEVLDHVLQAWTSDVHAGRDTLMIATDHTTVTDLNHRARAHLIHAGTVAADGVLTADGAAGVGDRIITRRNDRTLRHGHRNQHWVRNGDAWTVTATSPDGSFTATNPEGSLVTLDAGYVRAHVELGYALTAHQAQGRTVDTAHTVITAGTTREALYVAATRGRHTNTLNVVTDHDPDPDTAHHTQSEHDADEAFATVISTSGTDTSAHTALEAAAKARRVRRPPPTLAPTIEPDLEPDFGPSL